MSLSVTIVEKSLKKLCFLQMAIMAIAAPPVARKIRAGSCLPFHARHPVQKWVSAATCPHHVRPLLPAFPEVDFHGRAP